MTLENLKEAERLSKEIAQLEKLIKDGSIFLCLGASGYSASEFFEVGSINESPCHDEIMTALNKELTTLKNKFENL